MITPIFHGIRRYGSYSSIGAALLVLYLIITTVKDYKNADNKNVADGGDGGNEA